MLRRESQSSEEEWPCSFSSILASVEVIEVHREWHILLRAKACETSKEFIWVEWRTEGPEKFLLLNFWVDRGSYGSREEQSWEGKLGMKPSKERMTCRGGSTEKGGSGDGKQGRGREESPSAKLPSFALMGSHRAWVSLRDLNAGGKHGGGET